MNKGIFSSIVMFLVLFLVTATIIYSRLPIQAEKTISETELIKNYKFTAQIASFYASKTLSEAIGDHLFSQGFIYTSPITCSSSIVEAQLEAKYQAYLKNLDTNFGNCKIVNPTNPALPIDISITITSGTAAIFKQGNFSATIQIMCKSNQNPTQTNIDFNKTYSFNKIAYAEWTGAITGTTCAAIVKDIDAGNLKEYSP